MSSQSSKLSKQNFLITIKKKVKNDKQLQNVVTFHKRSTKNTIFALRKYFLGKTKRNNKVDSIDR